MKTVLILSIKYLDGTSRLFAFPDTVNGGKEIEKAKFFAESDVTRVLEANILSLEIGKYESKDFASKEAQEKANKIFNQILEGLNE